MKFGLFLLIVIATSFYFMWKLDTVTDVVTFTSNEGKTVIVEIKWGGGFRVSSK